METTSGKETIRVLRRLIAYSEKIFQLSKGYRTQRFDRTEVRSRASPQRAVVKSSLVLFWGRLAASTLGNRSGGPLLEALARRADLQAEPLGRVHAVLDAPGWGKGFTTFTAA